jgi:hypothetical protein
MPYFMVDDQLHSNQKTQNLVDMGQLGLAALGLWVFVGSYTQSQLADGQISPSVWRQVGSKPLFTKLAAVLVDVGLWEARGDAWQFHDWADMGYSTGAQVKLRRARTKELKNPEIRDQVKARDADLCRYCGRKVDWKIRNSDKGGTYDHVIPGLAAGVTNLVVSCRKCNQHKAQRTPEQAGMTLLPPPRGPDAGLDPGPDMSRANSDPAILKSGYPPIGKVKTRSRTGTDEVSGEVAAAAEVGPAGRAPQVPLVDGHTGSPWHNHHGPPPPDLEETHCATHGLDLPCRKCTSEHYAEEAS